MRLFIYYLVCIYLLNPLRASNMYINSFVFHVATQKRKTNLTICHWLVFIIPWRNSVHTVMKNIAFIILKYNYNSQQRMCRSSFFLNV